MANPLGFFTPDDLDEMTDAGLLASVGLSVDSGYCVSCLQLTSLNAAGLCLSCAGVSDVA